MSTELTNSITITPSSTDVFIDNQYDTVATNTHDITTEAASTTVEGHKKEYSIVGDGLYASINADEAPTWLLTIVGDVVANAVASGMVDYDLLVQDVQNAIASIDVASNKYVEKITFDAQVNALIASQLATLNVTYGNTFATKVELAALEASADSALAITALQLEAGYTDAINAKATEITTAYSSADAVNASNINALTAVFNGQNSEISAQATAISGLQTYVGVTEDNVPDGTGILSAIAILQKQNDGVIETFSGVHQPFNTAMDELRLDQWPYALWVPMEGTTDPVATTRVAYIDTTPANYPIPENTVYKNTTSNTYWEYVAGVWVSILETEYTSRLTAVRDLHIGDSFILYVDSGGTKQYTAAYKFLKTVIDTTSPFSTDDAGYTWAVVTDTSAEAAYITALNALDLADSKRRVFVNQGNPTPVPPYDIGDLWLVSTGDSAIGQSIGGRVIQVGDILRSQANVNTASSYSLSHWVFASRYTDDSTTVALASGLANGTVAVDLSNSTVDGVTSVTSYVTSQIDAQVVVFSGTNVNTAPTGKNDDLFIESKEVVDSLGNVYTETTIYKWVTSTWVAQTNADTSIAALSDLADGKRTIFSNVSHSTPVGELNDVWIPTTGTNNATYIPGEVYQYNGTAWVLATKYSENLNTFVNTVNNTIVPNLVNQIDAKIEYWFTLSTNDPKAAWTAAQKPNRNGDVWYQTDTKLSFYYTYSTDSWNAITDADALLALSNAAIAKNAADGKVSQFYAWGGTGAPADYVADGITIPANNYKYWYKVDGKLYYKPSATWVLVPTTIDSTMYISSGDLLTVFNPATRDYTYYSYNGTSWQQNGPTGIISTSKFFVDLENDVNGPSGSVAVGLSTLESSVTAHADAVGAGVEAKFEYNSTVSIDGTSYVAGFGLVNSTTLPESSYISVGQSEFWINASKFKLTNNNHTGVASPFSIDASGTTPNITFNGIVSFANVSGKPTHTSGAANPTGTAVNGSTYNQTTSGILWIYNNGWKESGDPLAIVPSDLSATGTTVIDGSRIDTGTITAVQIATGSLTSDTISVNNLAAISTILGNVEITESLMLNNPGAGLLAGRTSVSDYATNGFYIGREDRGGGVVGFEVSHTSVNAANNRIQGIIHDDEQGFTIYNPTVKYGGSASGGQTLYSANGTYNLGPASQLSISIAGGGGGGGGSRYDGYLSGVFAGNGGTTTVVFRNGSPTGAIIATYTAAGGTGGASAVSSVVTGTSGESTVFGAGGVGGTSQQPGNAGVGYGAGGGGAGGDSSSIFDASGGSGLGGSAGQVRNFTFNTNTTNNIYAVVTIGAGGAGGTASVNYAGGAGASGVVAVSSPLGGTQTVNYRSDKLVSTLTTSSAAATVTFSLNENFDKVDFYGSATYSFSAMAGYNSSVEYWLLQASVDGVTWVTTHRIYPTVTSYTTGGGGGNTYYTRSYSLKNSLIIYNFSLNYASFPQNDYEGNATSNSYNFVRFNTNGYGTIPAGSKFGILGGYYES